MRRIYAETVLNAILTSFMIHLMIVSEDLIGSLVVLVMLLLVGSAFPGQIIQKISEVENAEKSDD